MVIIQTASLFLIVFSCSNGDNTSTTEGPLDFNYDRIDGRLIWISNKTSDVSVDKLEYRRINKDSTGTVISSNDTWSPLPYDTRSPVWQKPDGICAEYEIRMTTSDGKEYSRIIESPIPTLKMESKIRPLGMFYDPTRNRVMVELSWGNDFDYWTAAGAVLIASAPWAKMVNCQSLFRDVVPPPTIENGGTVWAFDTEHVRNNCTFLIGVNGTIQVMRVPPTNQGQRVILANGQMIQVGASDNQMTQVGPNTQMAQSGANNQPMPEDRNCSILNFSTAISNDSLLLNLTCDTVAGASAICTPSQRQCKLDCSPLAIQAYNMEDNGEYLKIEWKFPENDIKGYHVKYVEANVTTWNTAYSDHTPTESSLDSNQSYVEIKEFSNGAGNAHNFTIQICADLNEKCTGQIQWEGERKHAVAYVPRLENSENSENLLQAGPSRRKAKNAGSTKDTGMFVLLLVYLGRAFLIINT